MPIRSVKSSFFLLLSLFALAAAQIEANSLPEAAIKIEKTINHFYPNDGINDKGLFLDSFGYKMISIAEGNRMNAEIHQQILSIIQEETELENLIQQSVSQGYDEKFIDLIEMIYGKGFLSQGGTASIDHMLKNVAIANQKILDIGSGLGGLALYLAEHYPLNITGLEPQKGLFTKSVESLNEKAGRLKGSAQFLLMDHPAHLNQFPDQSFDIIVSKESILHIPLEVKRAFFLEIARVLKPGGEIVIMDWMRTAIPYSPKTQKMMEMDGVAYHLITATDYQSILQDAGFTHVQIEDVSQETAHFSQENLYKIQELAPIIQEKYGQDVYEYCLESWGYQRDAFASKELIAGIFRAKKT